LAGQPPQSLNLAHDFAAGGSRFEHLPEETFQSEAHVEAAVAAIGAVVFLGKEVNGEQIAQVILELGQGSLAEALSAAAEGGEPGPESREKRSLHKAVYIPPLLTAVLASVFMKTSLREYERRYAALRSELHRVSWISEGYVQNRGPGAGGPCYQWTRKVKGKTVSVALSEEQFYWLKGAIENWQRMKQVIKEMQRLSRRVLFETVPHPPRRKRLGKKALGLI